MNGTELDELVIQAVKEHPVIWNKQLQNYRDKFARETAWMEVADAANITVPAAENRWRLLREHFGRLIRCKRKIAEAGNSRPGKKEWSYYDQMSFITEHIKSRSGGKYSILPTCDDVNSLSETDAAETDSSEQCDNRECITILPDLPNVMSITMEGGQSSTNTLSGIGTHDGSSGRKTKPATGNNDLQQVVQSVNNIATIISSGINMQFQGNDDIAFCMSLVPQMKAMRPRKKMKLRMDIMKLMFDATADEGEDN